MLGNDVDPTPIESRAVGRTVYRDRRMPGKDLIELAPAIWIEMLQSDNRCGKVLGQRRKYAGQRVESAGRRHEGDHRRREGPHARDATCTETCHKSRGDV